MTVPFLPEAPTWLAQGPVQHLARAVIAGRTVPIESGRLSINGSSIPTYTGTLVLPAAATADLMADLDPRVVPRVAVYGGYVYPDGTQDEHKICTVYPQNLELDEQAQTLTLDVASSEAALEDEVMLWHADANDLPRAGVPDAIRYVLQQRAPYVGFYSTVPDGSGADIMAELEPQAGDNYLDLFADITQAGGWRLYVDRDGAWRLGGRTDVPTIAGATTLSTGPDGTVTRLVERVGLEEWANVVHVRAPVYSDTETGHITVAVYQTAGPTGTDNAPFRTLSIREDQPMSIPTAYDRARTVLSRVHRLGAGHVIDAVAHYWILPDATVAIARQGRDTVHQLVRNVTYDLGSGSMTLSTREDTTPIYTDPPQA